MWIGCKKSLKIRVQSLYCFQIWLEMVKAGDLSSFFNWRSSTLLHLSTRLEYWSMDDRMTTDDRRQTTISRWTGNDVHNGYWTMERWTYMTDDTLQTMHNLRRTMHEGYQALDVWQGMMNCWGLSKIMDSSTLIDN